MLDEIEIEVTGLDELDRSMARFSAEFNRTAMVEGVQAAATFLAERARQKAPLVSKNFGRRKPGELRDSIGVVMRKFGIDHPEYTCATVCPVYGISGAPDSSQDPGVWGQYVEFGSVHNPIPEPYLRPAFDEGAAEAVNIFVQTAAKFFNQNAGGDGI
jgi:HK97 gp10 family phage protein